MYAEAMDMHVEEVLCDMDALPAELRSRLNASPLLGYLNFSDGRPDGKFQKNLADAWSILRESGDPAPWLTLPRWLLAECETLAQSGSAAFRDVTQVMAVVRVALSRLPAAYREHHRDLLVHQPDGMLFGPFFLARACEAVLAQSAPWDEEPRLLIGAITKLNDYVGHRPIALLETRPQTEYYPHEKVRPIPLYLRSAGFAPSRYQPVLEKALELLPLVHPDLLADACFDPDMLDELGLDPRAYDHHHPVNRRPNYLFGEWDAHHIDGRGNYRRFVMRQVTLDALCDWMGDDTGERLVEAGTVLAGTILMATGVSGSGPSTHDSGTTLTTLVPRIARYRDRFYNEAIERIGGEHGERLRAESKQLRQPFAKVRQHLNQTLAKQRAFHLQERQLAILFAEMGYPEASRHRARQIPVASVRILSEIHLRQTACQLAIDRGTRDEVPRLLAEIEDLLHRGIECGALADPWNILGFQGLFPLFTSREDSTRDPRVDELLSIVSFQFDIYSTALAAASIAGESTGVLQNGIEEFANWWDRFATSDVSDLAVRVHGGERTQAALHVAHALAAWQSRDDDANDLTFWRSHHEGFRTPAAYAQVIEALIRYRDWRAAFGLLMTWLGDAESVPLEETGTSFQRLLVQWFDRVLALPADEFARVNLPLTRVFDLLEANAEQYWQVPNLNPHATESNQEQEDTFEAAYEDMSYQDSTDDGEDGAVIGFRESRSGDFALEEQHDELVQRLQFLSTVAKLWQAVAPVEIRQRSHPNPQWLDSATQMQSRLEGLLDELATLTIPDPLGEFDAMVEYDRRRSLKESAIDATIQAMVDIGLAVRSLTAFEPIDTEDESWQRIAIRLEHAIHRKEPHTVRRLLPLWLRGFRTEPLLLVPIANGGTPRQLFRTRSALAMIQSMLERLPHLGLLREAYHLIQLARQMEQNPVGEGQRVSEFDRLFRIAVQSIVETLLDGATQWVNELGEKAPILNEVLQQIATSLMKLWIAHSDTLQLSVLESVSKETEWEQLRSFVQAYGNDLFTVQFLAMGNMRGILHRGGIAYIDGVLEQNDATPWPKLIEEIAANQMSKERAARNLEVVLRALLEHYKEYCDYNATTAHSDYGENLHQLLDFLRLKVKYERYAWRMRPMMLAHEALCRRGYEATADRWRAEIMKGEAGGYAHVPERIAGTGDEVRHSVTHDSRSARRTLRSAVDAGPIVCDGGTGDARGGHAQCDAFRPTGGALAAADE